MNAIPYSLLAGPVSAFALTVLLIPLVRGAAIAAGRVTAVRRDRWHEKPTPSLGGVGIFLGFGLVVWLASLLSWQDPLTSAQVRMGILPLSPWEALVAASSLAFLVGLVDDFVQLRPTAKLAGQLLAASILLMSGIGLWLTGIYLVDALLSLVWFIGITNALNLLDNMDGLAGGVALISAGFLSVIFFLDGSPGLAGLALALVGSLLGFLVHNYPPAKIFMGDSGSLFLGMLLSGLALSPGPGLSRSLLAIMAVPTLVLAVPILDTTLVTVSRVLEGRSPAEGGKDHSSHRLVSLGMSQERAVWVLWLLSVFGGGVGLLFRTTARSYALLGGGIAVVGLILVGGYLLQARFQKLREEGLSGTDLYERLLRLHARFPILLFALDGLLVGLAYLGAYLLRWDSPQLARELAYFQRSLPVVLVVKLVVFVSLRIYREDLRHYGLGEALRVLRANLLATISVVAALTMLQRTGLSRGVVAIDFLLASIFTLAGRFSFRIMETWARRWSRAGTA
ncbi:MAG: MraY family glycosyltransferase, partial [Longimicrobiales bacterium]